MKRADVRLSLVAVGLICAIALGLRSARLGSMRFWYDEALILDIDHISGSPWTYAAKIWASTTYNPGWPLLVWSSIHAFGDSLVAARAPSCIAGTLAVGAMYWAARSLRLDRRTAIISATFLCMSRHAIVYSQQILPYAAVPLLAVTFVGLLARIDQARTGRGAVRWFGLLHFALLATCAVFVVVHNSFAVLTPVLASFLGLSALSRRPGSRGGLEQSREVGGDEAPRIGPLRSAAWHAALLLVVAVVCAFFFLPKQGEGRRDYLSAFYYPTFRQAIWSFQPPLDQLDAWYRSRLSRPSAVWDPVYYLLSRTGDWLVVSLNPWLPATTPSMVATLPLAALAVVGSLELLRGRHGQTAARIMAGGIVGLASVVVLSAFALYPFGGVRQLLPLTPWAIIPAAVGARRLCCSFPRAAVTLTVLFVVSALVVSPSYYREGRATLSRARLHRLMQKSGTTDVVASDCWWSCACLKYFAGAELKDHVIEPPYPAFDELLRSRRPFLLIALGPSPLDRTAKGWCLARPFLDFRPWGFDLERYDVEPLLRVEAPTVQQHVNAFVLRPRLDRDSPRARSSRDATPTKLQSGRIASLPAT